MADIFISYKREDSAFVERLARRLEANGWSVWWDTRLKTGEVWDRVIERELQTAACIVVVWSPRSLQSDPVLAEASYARSHGKLVPIGIGDARPPVTFAHLQTTDFSRWRGSDDEDSFVALVEAIRLLCVPAGTRNAPGSSANEARGQRTAPLRTAGGSTSAGMIVIGLAVIGVAAGLLAAYNLTGSPNVAGNAAATMPGPLLGVAAVPNIPASFFFVEGRNHRIDGLLIKVADRPLKLSHMTVLFANGVKEFVRLDALIAPGQTYGPIRLPPNGAVQGITFMGASEDLNFRGQPYKPSAVEVYASR